MSNNHQQQQQQQQQPPLRVTRSLLRRRRSKWSRMLLATGFFFTVLGVYFWYQRNGASLVKALLSSTTTTFFQKKANEEDPIVLISHHPKKPARIHESGTSMDACRILPECYPGAGSIFRNVESCHENIPWILKNFDSSTLVQNNKVVGFISFHLNKDPANPNNAAILVYNVCVDPALRAKGLARRMMHEGVEEMLDHYKIRDRKILLGLDVDLSSKMADVAFALYAKLGFVRGWQPCYSVGDVDWRPLFEPGHKATRSPLDAILDNPATYVNGVLVERKTGPLLPGRSSKQTPDHYCMFKFYSESWQTMGAALAAPFQPPPHKAAATP